MKYLIIILIILFSGCTKIDADNIENAVKLCEPNGGLDYIYLGTWLSAVCVNGAVFKHSVWHKVD